MVSLLGFLTRSSFGQSDSIPFTSYQSRKIILASSTTAISLASLVYLNNAWYNQFNTGKFHFFDDNAEWLQMDKIGHLFTTYQTGRLMMEAYQWAGFRKKHVLVSGGAGFVYMTAIEVLDGFSNGWGFSWGDQVSNALGTSSAILQHAFWNEQRISVKFSYASSGLAKYNPKLLGENFYTQILKDYNGQTLWLSINPSAFFKPQSKFPKWLNLAFGYSAYGMLGAFSNSFVVQDSDGNVLKFDRARRYYFSLDVDLTRVKTKSKILKSVFSVVNILKFPFPAIQFSQNKWRFYPLYY